MLLPISRNVPAGIGAMSAPIKIADEAGEVK
jgi:hypothetical protein